MNKYLKYIITLILLILITDRILVSALNYISKNSNIRFSNILNEKVDFFVLGNSRGVNSLNEFEFEKKHDLELLNISYNGLSNREIEYLISFLDPSKIMVIEISVFLNSSKDSKIQKTNRFNSFKYLRNKEFIGEIFNLYYYNNELTLRTLYYYFKSDKNWSNNKILNDIKLEYLLSLTGNSYLDLEKYRSFKFFLDQNNYNYLMYYAPIHPRAKDKILNWKSINDVLKNELGEKYLDISDLIQDDDGFADLIHTNHNSSLKINAEMYKFISHHYSKNLVIEKE